jgi:hypothetical protein
LRGALRQATRDFFAKQSEPLFISERQGQRLPFSEDSERFRDLTFAKEDASFTKQATEAFRRSFRKNFSHAGSP